MVYVFNFLVSEVNITGIHIFSALRFFSPSPSLSLLVRMRSLVWLFSEGFASFSVSFEVCAYAVLDIIAKVIFGFIVMAAHDQLGAASASSQEYV